MHICIDSQGKVELTEAAEFTAFDIHAADPSTEGVLAALDTQGHRAPEPDHVFVSIEAVRRLAGVVADDAWEAGFGAMLAYADSKGWLDEDQCAIKAHIESA